MFLYTTSSTCYKYKKYKPDKPSLHSNSRPLVADTGYWAESLPLMDAPLCAVIDPIRDYRWHALRCGGPETASFLCEMPGKLSADGGEWVRGEGTLKG